MAQRVIESESVTYGVIERDRVPDRVIERVGQMEIER